MIDRLFLLAILLFFLLTSLQFSETTVQGHPEGTRSVQGDPLNTSAQNTVTLITTGDVMLGRYVNLSMVRTNNFKLPFENTAEILKGADLVFINLENPITDPCPLTSSGMIFCADKRSIEGLKFAGIDVASLANNHIHNYKQEGIQQTMQFLEEAGIAYTGIDGAYLTTVKNTRFAFLGYNDVERLNFDTFDKLNVNPERVPFQGRRIDISWAEEERISREVSGTKQNADIVVVAFHFGNEYQSMPSKRQKELAHLAVDSGADIVLGHHPHWIQPVERYEGKVIIYSHGNFIFDQNWSQETREGLVSKFTFYNKTLADIEFLPVSINTNGQATFLTGREKDRILTRFANLNSKLQE